MVMIVCKIDGDGWCVMVIVKCGDGDVRDFDRI